MDNVVTLSDVAIRLAAVFGAVSVLAGAVFAVYRWYLHRNEKDKAHDADIARMKTENALIVYALSACLDGLMQLGANHTVPVAKERLDKYINLQAHK